MELSGTVLAETLGTVNNLFKGLNPVLVNGVRLSFYSKRLDQVDT